MTPPPPVFACCVHVDFRARGPDRGGTHFSVDDGPYRSGAAAAYGAPRFVDVPAGVVDICARRTPHFPDVRHYSARVQDRRRRGPGIDRAGYAAGAALDHHGHPRGNGRRNAEKEDAGITPLGIPMLAGPEAMSSVTVLMSQGESVDWLHRGIVLAAVATASLASFLVLAAADRVGSYLHETGIRILTRLMGLLLTAIAVQFILDGLRDVGVVR